MPVYRLGIETFLYYNLFDYMFAIDMMSANTPAAVTEAPAPYPWMSIGYWLYRSVVMRMMLFEPSRSYHG